MKADPHRRPHPAPGARRTGLALALCLPLAALAQPSVPPLIRCEQLAEAPHTMRLHAGVYTEEAIASAPLEIRLPPSFNGGAYMECLVDHGALETLRDDVYLAAVSHCREAGAGAARLQRSPTGHLRVGGDAAGFAECVRSRLSDVQVEVLPRD